MNLLSSCSFINQANSLLTMASNSHTPAPTSRCDHKSANSSECPVDCLAGRTIARPGGAFHRVAREHKLEDTNDEPIENAMEVKAPKLTKITEVAQEVKEKKPTKISDVEVEHANSFEPQKFKES